jgi:hypothetical protein
MKLDAQKALVLHLALELLSDFMGGMSSNMKTWKLKNEGAIERVLAADPATEALQVRRVAAVQELVKVIALADEHNIAKTTEVLEQLLAGKIAEVADPDAEDDALVVYTPNQVRRMFGRLRQDLLPFFATPLPLDAAINKITTNLDQLPE